MRHIRHQKLLASILATGLILSQRIVAAESLDRSKLFRIDSEIALAMAEKQLPGAVLWIEHQSNRYEKAYGDRALFPEPEAMTKDTIFDLASLTKVVATTPAIMLLVERGRIDLDASASTYLPEFKANGKEAITIRHLITHVSWLASRLAAS